MKKFLRKIKGNKPIILGLFILIPVVIQIFFSLVELYQKSFTQFIMVLFLHLIIFCIVDSAKEVGRIRASNILLKKNEFYGEYEKMSDTFLLFCLFFVVFSSFFTIYFIQNFGFNTIVGIYITVLCAIFGYYFNVFTIHYENLNLIKMLKQQTDAH